MVDLPGPNGATLPACPEPRPWPSRVSRSVQTRSSSRVGRYKARATSAVTGRTSDRPTSGSSAGVGRCPVQPSTAPTSSPSPGEEFDAEVGRAGVDRDVGGNDDSSAVPPVEPDLLS